MTRRVPLTTLRAAVAELSRDEDDQVLIAAELARRFPSAPASDVRRALAGR